MAKEPVADMQWRIMSKSTFLTLALSASLTACAPGQVDSEESVPSDAVETGPVSPGTDDAEVSPTPSPVEMVNKPALWVTLFSQGDVEQDTKRWARWTTKRAIGFFKAPRPKGPKEEIGLTLWARTPPGRRGICAFNDLIGINIYLESSCWQKSSEVGRTHIIVHEVFHAYQRTLTTQGHAGPMWMLEGSADLAAADAIRAWGMGDVSVYRANQRSSARSEARSLRKLASESAWTDRSVAGPKYSLAYLAVDLLVDSKGWKKVAAFYREMGEQEELDWRAAFRSVFDKSPGRFYREFKSYRQAGFTR